MEKLFLEDAVWIVILVFFYLFIIIIIIFTLQYCIGFASM